MSMNRPGVVLSLAYANPETDAPGEQKSCGGMFKRDGDGPQQARRPTNPLQAHLPTDLQKLFVLIPISTMLTLDLNGTR